MRKGGRGKGGSGPAAAHFPPHLLAMFAAPPPTAFPPPKPNLKQGRGYTGLASLVSFLKNNTQETTQEKATEAPAAPAAPAAPVPEVVPEAAPAVVVAPDVVPSIEPSITEAAMKKMRVVDLKKELKKRGLEEKGKKAILFARLKEAVDAEVTPEPEVAPVVVVATNPSSKTNTSIKKEETTTKESSQETTKETSSSSTSSSSTDATTPIPIPISSSTTMQSILTDLFEKGTAPTYVPNLTATEAKKERKLKEVQAFRQYQEPLIESWKLQKEERKDGTGSAMSTLFVGRLSYDCTRNDLEDVFRQYGPIRNIMIVRTPEGRPCGYAFVEFEHSDHVKGKINRY